MADARDYAQKIARFKLLQLLQDLGLSSCDRSRTLAWLDVMDFLVQGIGEG